MVIKQEYGYITSLGSSGEDRRDARLFCCRLLPADLNFGCTLSCAFSACIVSFSLASIACSFTTQNTTTPFPQQKRQLLIKWFLCQFYVTIYSISSDSLFIRLSPVCLIKVTWVKAKSHKETDFGVVMVNIECFLNSLP